MNRRRRSRPFLFRGLFTALGSALGRFTPRQVDAGTMPDYKEETNLLV